MVPDDDVGVDRHVLVDHPGASPVWIQIGQDNDEAATRLRSKSLKASPDAETVGALKEVFGLGRVRLIRAIIPQIDTSASDRRARFKKNANDG